MTPSTQKDAFFSSEADAWYHRNEHSLSGMSPENDDILLALTRAEVVPRNVLEVGCSNGYRLNWIKQESPSARVCGIDPSSEAVRYGTQLYPEVELKVASASDLPYENDSFDLLIYGFCLYLCDRQDLFKIAYEADRVLKDGGVLVIKDFLPSFPYRNKYSHLDGCYSYKMDYGKMFLWNPEYVVVHQELTTHSGKAMRHIADERIGVTILQKNISNAYVDSSYLAK